MVLMSRPGLASLRSQPGFDVATWPGAAWRRDIVLGRDKGRLPGRVATSARNARDREAV